MIDFIYVGAVAGGLILLILIDDVVGRIEDRRRKRRS